MALTFTDNNGSTFININECRSFNLTLTTSLSALANNVCSEVILLNKTGQLVYVYDSNYFDDTNRIALSANETFTLRGITNSMQVSAKTHTGSGPLYYRTQYFSCLPQR